MSVATILKAVDRSLRNSPLRAVVRATGLGAWGRSVYHNAILRKGLQERTYFGKTLKFVVTSAREVAMVDGDYCEDDFVARLLDCQQPGDVIFDIGANIGTVALLLAAHGRPNGVTVHAFEPESRNAAHLRKNIEINGLDNVRVHELALGAEPGRLPLFISGTVGAGEHSLLSDHRQVGERVEVEVAPGAAYCARHALAPDLLKIDVEGAETLVLEGFKPMLAAQAIRDVLIEVHVATIAKHGWTPARLEAWMGELGYRKVWAHERASELHQHYRASVRSPREGVQP